MRTYDTYKDSGISWLGQIPSHWDVRRTKTIWEEHVSLSETGTEQLLSVSQYDGVKPNDEGSRSESLVGYKIVDSSNLVINIMLAWLGGLGVSQHKGIVSPAYCVYKLKENHCPEYFHYLYRTAMYLAEFARKSTGVVPSRWRMYTDSFGTVLSLVPPLAEQEAIVAYLDSATAEIDKAIASQQRMVELLQERKQIIINQAVTQGLNPDAPMKPTNIDWLPQIPAHWQCQKIAWLYLPNIGSGTTPMSGNDKYYTDSGINWVQSGDLNKKRISDTSKKVTELAIKDYGLKVYPKGSLAIAMYGASIGNLGLFDIDAAVNQACCVLGVSNRMNQTFAYYVLIASKQHLINQSSGGGQPNISQEKIKALRVPVPPLPEQNDIVNHIESSLNPIDNAISRCEQKIALLTERKQILINDVVTGKIKVTYYDY